MALYGTDVHPFLDPEIPIDIIPTYSNLRIPYEILGIMEPTNNTNQSISIVINNIQTSIWKPICSMYGIFTNICPTVDFYINIPYMEHMGNTIPLL
jgi:hypothetical protein